MRANREKLEQLYLQQADLEEKRKGQFDDYWDTRHTNTLQGYDRNAWTSKLSRFFGWESETNKKKALDQTDAELRQVDAKIAELEKKVVPEPTMPEWNNGGGGSGSGGGGGHSGGGGNTTTTTRSTERLISLFCKLPDVLLTHGRHT